MAKVLEVLKIAVDVDASLNKFVNCTGDDKVQSRKMPKTDLSTTKTGSN